jgi:SAM-dependent methyltransferase
MLAPALTILLSSFLLFLVQPIIAKQILPWFGGSASVWTICLVFFQLVLLLGYTYAHWLTHRQRGSRQYRLHIFILLISCLMLPIIPSSFWKPGPHTEPTLQILGLLAATVGLPYMLLASTGPLLQSWLSGGSNNDVRKHSIYRLFALSNFGSLLGLLSYPFSIEPFATVRVQEMAWSGGYSIFVVCLIRYAWKKSRFPDIRSEAKAAAVSGGPSVRSYLYWIGCAALGSSLLLSVTNQITQNVASIPFLWIAPLSTYLLSFVICFEGRSGRGWYDRRYWLALALLGTGAMAWALFANQANLSIFVALPVFIVGLLFGCVVCHGELARSKPNPEFLTQFYLSLAAGGALGGILVGIVAPQIFSNYWEMPLALISLALLCFYACCEEISALPGTSWTANIIIGALATALILLMCQGLPSAWDSYTLPWAKIAMGNAHWGLTALLIMSGLLLQKYRFSRAVAVMTLLCTLSFTWNYYRGRSADNHFARRNFYGTLSTMDLPKGAEQFRVLKHGVITHGSQFLAPEQRSKPLTYYSETSGIGRLLLAEHRVIGPLRIGSVGLGAGTLAAYGIPGDLFRVYELNPAVLEVAQTQFFYLKDSKARVEPVLGDARLSIEREIASGEFADSDQRFDVLSLDAFSGDAIPVHLLTREAFAIYVRTLKPDGVIAFHLSNNYLALPAVIAQIAREAGFELMLIADRPAAPSISAPSDWVLVTKNTAILHQPELAGHGTPISLRGGMHTWTDQFSNLFQILK